MLFLAKHNNWGVEVANEFLSDEAGEADILSHMQDDERIRYLNYGHKQMEAAFVDRVFVIYKPTGLLPNKQHREPEVLNTVKLVDFSMTHTQGATIALEESAMGQRMQVGHVPKKLFGYPVFVSVPARMGLRWDGRLVDGLVQRSLSFVMLVKTKNKSSFYSKGNVYCETPNNFMRLYPNVTGAFKF